MNDDHAARGAPELDEALADLRKAVEVGHPWHPGDFEAFTPKRAKTVATILNAALDGSLAPAALAASPEVAALIETTLAALQDPLVVHLNMVAGKIAKPLPSQLVHIYGEDVIRSAFAALIREAEARGMERACLAVSERSEWPEDEHGRTEQPELFARVINAILAEAAALKGA